MKHRAQPLRQFLRRRHLVRNRCLSNLCLGAHDALGERCRRNQKCPGNLFRCQAADFAKSERNLSFRRQSGMAAGENQLFISNLFIPAGSVVDARFHMGNKISLCSIEARASAHCVYGFEACRRNQPGAWLVRNASKRPGLQSGSERLVHRLFGEVQVSEKAHERRQNPARFRAVESLNGSAELFGRKRRHVRQPSKRRRWTQLPSGFLYPQFIGVTISCASSISALSPMHSSRTIGNGKSA